MNTQRQLGKRIIAITTITTMAAVGLANAQTPNTTANMTDSQKGIITQVMELFKSGKTTEAKTLLEQNGLKAMMGGKGKMGMHGKGHGGMGKGHESRKTVEDAIIAGNFTNFKAIASTTPLAKIDQATFNLLTPQFLAKKNTEDQIRSILKAAGTAEPTRAGNK